MSETSENVELEHDTDDEHGSYQEWLHSTFREIDDLTASYRAVDDELSYAGGEGVLSGCNGCSTGPQAELYDQALSSINNLLTAAAGLHYAFEACRDELSAQKETLAQQTENPEQSPTPKAAGGVELSL